LYHDYLSSRSVTGVLHLVNQTPVEWYCKRQATVETATYRFEDCNGAGDGLALYTAHARGSYIGIGDVWRQSECSDEQHSQLNKRHNALAYHRVREAIASKILRFFHMDGKNNPADVLSKHCGYQDAWPHIQTLLFWAGDTSQIGMKPKEGDLSSGQRGVTESFQG
jgi:hypothetical protein